MTPFFQDTYEWFFCPACQFWFAIDDRELLLVQFRPLCPNGHTLTERAHGKAWLHLTCTWGLLQSIEDNTLQRPCISEQRYYHMQRLLLRFFREERERKDRIF